MTTLKEDRVLFSRLVSQLLNRLNELNIGYMIDEVRRDPRIAKLNAQSGAGIAKSLHINALAIDLDLLGDDGEVLVDGSHRFYRIAGTYWTHLDARCAWGGNFKRVDSRHFSLSRGGIK